MNVYFALRKYSNLNFNIFSIYYYNILSLFKEQQKVAQIIMSYSDSSSPFHYNRNRKTLVSARTFDCRVNQENANVLRRLDKKIGQKQTNCLKLAQSRHCMVRSVLTAFQASPNGQTWQFTSEYIVLVACVPWYELKYSIFSIRLWNVYWWISFCFSSRNTNYSTQNSKLSARDSFLEVSEFQGSSRVVWDFTATVNFYLSGAVH